MERVPEFDEYLDMAYEVTSVVGLTFYPSQVLFACDPIAYRIYSNDYLSELKEDEE
jgi:hypothetical protein